MGAEYRFTCSKCDYSISTSGPWEFYRDEKGRRKLYGHPVPRSEEAERSGIYGFSGKLYCPACDKISNLILLEYKNPCHDQLSAWMGQREVKDEFRNDQGVKCRKCGGKDLVLYPEEHREIPCPRCKKGRLMGQMSWIS